MDQSGPGETLRMSLQIRDNGTDACSTGNEDEDHGDDGDGVGNSSGDTSIESQTLITPDSLPYMVSIPLHSVPSISYWRQHVIQSCELNHLGVLTELCSRPQDRKRHLESPSQ